MNPHCECSGSLKYPHTHTHTQVQLGVMDVYMSPEHMLPMQWFPLVDPASDLPSEPLGYIKLNCIINTLNERGAVQLRAPDEVGDWELQQKKILQIPRLNMRKVASHQYNLKFFVYQVRNIVCC